MFAMLGEVRFELLGSFTDLEETHSASYAKHEVLAGRPRLQAMGNELTQIRFGLKLHWKLGDVDAAYKGLISAKEAQQAVSLVFGSGRFVGWFVIESLTARTLLQDGRGRTAARELDVSLTEFVGDPNNPLPTPGVANGQNPLLAMLPESVRAPLSKVADAVQTGVRIYRSVEQEVGQLQTLIAHARELKHDPLALLGVVGDAVNLGGAALGKLNRLPEVGKYIGNLSGAAEMLAYIKGRFLLSINDVSPIREIFTGFQFKEVSLRYSINKEITTEADELLIANYPINIEQAESA